MNQFPNFFIALVIFASYLLADGIYKSKLSLEKIIGAIEMNDFKIANRLSFPKIPNDTVVIKIAVIDYGIKNHEVFSQFIPSQSRQPALNTNPMNHGIHVSGILKALNPKVELIAIEALETETDFASQINLAIEQKVKIINISGGGAGFKTIEYRAIARAEKHGILVIVSSGNEGQDIATLGHEYYPASYKLPNILSVGFLNRQGEISPQSNFGAAVDFYAPGDNILSRAHYCKGFCFVNTGSSMATPYVSALAALVWQQNPEYNYEQVMNELGKMSKNGKFYY